jgi:DNA mismatch repair ATPase MutS
MTFLQVANDSITISTLPHPVSMFFLGVSLVISIYLYFELVRLRGEVRAITKENKEINDKIKNTKIEVDKLVGELSKKVDSRVDKAIESMKKLTNK